MYVACLINPAERLKNRGTLFHIRPKENVLFPATLPTIAFCAYTQYFMAILAKALLL